MSARHGGLADGHGAMATPVQLDTKDYSQSSDFTGPTYEPTRVGPISVQNQVLYTGTADWLLEVPDASTDSGFYHIPSVIEPDPGHGPTSPDGQLHSTPSELSHLETGRWCNGSLNVAPWFPGSRTDPDLDVDVSFQRESVPYPITESLDESNAELLSHNNVHYDASLPDTSECFPDHTGPKTKPQTDVTTCGRCGKQFTGQYQRGNYARHVKQQHRDAEKSLKQRTCRECKKTFKRQDARRKHEWVVHGLRESEPCLRKPKSTQYGSRQPSIADLDEMTSQRKVSLSSPTCNYFGKGDVVSSCYRVPMYSENAHELFTSIRTSLGIGTYNPFCETILVRWEQIVEEMRRNGFEAYGSFARVLVRLVMQIRPEHTRTNNPQLHTAALSKELQNDVATEQDNLDATADVAAESTILNDVRNIAEWFLARNHSQTAPEIRSSDEVVAEYRMRKENPGLGHQARDETESDINANGLRRSFLSPAPVTGNIRKSSIDANTQPSTRYPGNNTNSFPTSSQTSWSLVDDSSFTNQLDPSWSSMMKTDALAFSQSTFYAPQPEPSGPTSESMSASQKLGHIVPRSPLSAPAEYVQSGSGSSQMQQVADPGYKNEWTQLFPDTFAE